MPFDATISVSDALVDSPWAIICILWAVMGLGGVDLRGSFSWCLGRKLPPNGLTRKYCTVLGVYRRKCRYLCEWGKKTKGRTCKSTCKNTCRRFDSHRLGVTPHYHIHPCDSNNHFPDSQLLPDAAAFMRRQKMEQKCLFDATINVSDALVDSPWAIICILWAVMGSTPEGHFRGVWERKLPRICLVLFYPPGRIALRWEWIDGKCRCMAFDGETILLLMALLDLCKKEKLARKPEVVHGNQLSRIFGFSNVDCTFSKSYWLYFFTTHSQYTRHPIKHNRRLQSHSCRPIATRSASGHPIFFLFPDPIIQTPHYPIHLYDSNNHFPNSQLLPDSAAFMSRVKMEQKCLLMPLLASPDALVDSPWAIICILLGCDGGGEGGFGP
ncbi:hypothetical protein CEXT_370601 [Caerostris extrusa]|uniref:C2H2-type domain-containing protein n=1 Tax=Caerostris extrusa TaxID=172846 RepID=A0AAV4Y1C7_CAEEX|nr:hypothetical protein CEXT_370601 [Caerostris extrusa]